VSIPTFSVVKNQLKHLVYQKLPLDVSIQDFVKLSTFRTKFLASVGSSNTNTIISCILLSSLAKFHYFKSFNQFLIIKNVTIDANFTLIGQRPQYKNYKIYLYRHLVTKFE